MPEKDVVPGRPFRPMEPVLWPEPFDDSDWLFQPKWDGVRLLAHSQPCGVRLFSKRGRDRSVQYPELVAALPECLAGAGAVLDGEAVVFWQDRTSFPRIMQRELASRPETIAAMQASLPVTYMIFDLVHLNGRSLLAVELEERQDMLRQYLTPAGPVVITDSFPARGLLLFAAVRERNWEGVVAKRRGSLYRPGGKSRDWRKIKIRQRQLGAVGGFTIGSRGPGSLLLGAYRGSDLLYIGRVSSGLTEEHLGLLSSRLVVTAECPFTPVPHLTGVRVRWVRPEICVLVEFSEWTERLQLRHPVVRCFTSDPVTACLLP